MSDTRKIKTKPAVKIAAKPVKLKNKPIQFLGRISLRNRIKLRDGREPAVPDEQS
jgi:hypothetical protein